MAQEMKLITKKGFNWLGLGFFALVILTFIAAVSPFYYAVMTSFESGQQLIEPNYLPQLPKQDQYNIFIRSHPEDFVKVGACDESLKCSNENIENYMQSLDRWGKIKLTNKVLFKNYIFVFVQKKFYRNFANSVLVATCTVVLAMILALTASFALARISFKGRGAILMVILSISTFPQVAILSGMYQMVYYLDLFNDYKSLILSYTVFTLPFTIWILTTFIRQIPVELEEAAIMDGANPLQTLFRIFLPLLWPAIVTTGLLAFIGAWNEYLFALSFIIDTSHQTVTPVIASLTAGTSRYEVAGGTIMAASVSITIPLIILVLIFQRKIVSGLTGGAIKG
ncbi:MAG: carbohydrate ABC transporter permease [Alphaproteobacteria bacterium]